MIGRSQAREPESPAALRSRADGAPRAWEWIGLALILLLGFHFLALRIRGAAMPQGDEGSWLATAAELARGRGFTTRWLEFHWLKPYALPRPDDFRFPGLTGLLALVFQFTGVSWHAAQWTVTCVFLLAVVAAWLALRRFYGRWTALAACLLTCVSLVQLQWASAVYTESLFALVVSGLFLSASTGDASTRMWWLRLGAGVGLLYLVRPNGLLFAFGLPGAWLWQRRAASGPGDRTRAWPWDRPALGLAAMVTVMLPWLARMWLRFGNPFHVAGSAGMLRNTRSEPSTYGLAEYVRLNGALFPLRRVTGGAWEFLRILHEQEHGLEAVPLALALVALLRRRPFYRPFFGFGFGFSFLAIAYVSYNSWAGVRYAAPLLPFVYAYGLAQLPDFWARLKARRPRQGASLRNLEVTLALGAALALALPVLYPHRFYERKFARPADAGASVADHLRRLQSLVPPDGRYYAGALAHVNFLANRDCVGLQELNDSTWFTRSQELLHPRWVALERGEDADSSIHAALECMRAHGYDLDTADAGTLGVYLVLRKRGGTGN